MEPPFALAPLVRGFLDQTLTAAQWTHQAHMAVGAWLVHQHGPEDALPQLRHGIRRLNVALGGVNSDTRGYHETITAAYATLLGDFFDRYADGLKPDAAVARVLASPLTTRDALLRFYSRPCLDSIEARRRWVEPDLAPLRASALYGGTFTARLFRYPGKGGWTFAPVPDGCTPPVTHGWGRTPVQAEVDGHAWDTSVWRGKDGRTLLAVPLAVRGLKGDGDSVLVRLLFD